MATEWKRRSTRQHVDVGLEDFETEQLLQELINRGIITQNIALTLAARENKIDFIPGPDEITTAHHELLMGRKAEALIHIERALGGEFIGRLT